MKQPIRLVIGLFVVLACASTNASDPVKYRRPFDIGVTVWNFMDHDTAAGCKSYTCLTGCAFGIGKAYNNHGGTDYMMPIGTVVRAGAQGVFYSMYDGCDNIGYFGSKCGGGYGNNVKIRHADGVYSIYAHLKKDGVITGTPGVTAITCGQQIGWSASSGSSSDPHLHFELRTHPSYLSTAIDPYGGACSGPSYWTSISGVAPGTTCQIFDDHGNTTALATTLPLSTMTNGNIETFGDVDMFKFTTNGGITTMETFGATDTFCHLYNSAGAQITQDDDGGQDYNCRIVSTLAGGTYYLKVRHYDQVASTGAYQIKVNVVQNSDDHSDVYTGATQLYFGSPKSGTIGVAGDTDFFTFSTSSGTVIIETAGSTDTYCYLYSTWQSLLAEDDDDGPGTNCRMTPQLGNGTYYIKVRHFSQNGTGPYQISVTLAPSTVNPSVASTPAWLTVGGTFNQAGSGFTPYGTVWLYFQKPDGSQYPPVAKTANGSGSYTHTYTVQTTTPKGTFWYWAVDATTGQSSYAVSYGVY